MKRLLSVLLTICIILTLAPVAAFAEENAGGICGDGLCWSVDADGTVRISGSGDMYDYPAVKLGSGYRTTAPWASCTPAMTALVIEDGVTSIGTSAFLGCIDLQSVVIGDSVKTVGSRAFEGCENLRTLTVGDGVEAVRDRAFYGCSALTAAVLPETLGTIGNYAFFGCESLGTVWIPASTRSVGSYAFSKCGMSTADIAAELTELPEGIFANCSKLVSVTLPESIESIGKKAFYGCSLLSILTVPAGLKSIASYAFYNCSSLSAFAIPDGVKTVEPWTFGNCSSLKTLTVPKGIESISDRAFYGCVALEKLAVGQSIEEWCSFDKGADNDSLDTATVTTEKYASILGYGYSEDGLFWVLDGKGTLTISGEGAMTDYTYTSTETGKFTTAPWGRFAGSIKRVVIEYGVTEIGDCAFYGLEKLTAATTPDSLMRVGANAFRACTKLTTVVLGNNLAEIGMCAFYSCSELKSISIPTTVTVIGEAAFSYCESLTRIAVPEGVKAIEKWTFYQCKALVDLVIGSSVEKIGDSSFCYCGELTDLDIPDSVSEIGTWAFGYCAGVKTINFSIRTKHIGEYAFCGCNSITDTYFGGSKAQWASVNVEAYNDPIKYAVQHFAKLDAPTITVTNVASTGKLQLKWTAVDGASQYELYRSTEKNGDYSRIYTTVKTSVTTTVGDIGKTYYYKVKSISEDENTASSELGVAAAGTFKCAAPVIRSENVASSGKIRLIWSAVEGVEKYEVYRATSEKGTYTKYYTTTSLSYTNTSASAGYTYYYKVKAVGADESSASEFSNLAYRTCDCASATVKIALSSGDPKLTWSAVTGAKSYVIYRATSSTGSYTKLATTTNLSYTDKSAASGRTYYYKVICLSSRTSAADSAYSTPVYIRAK